MYIGRSCYRRFGKCFRSSSDPCSKRNVQLLPAHPYQQLQRQQHASFSASSAVVVTDSNTTLEDDDDDCCNDETVQLSTLATTNTSSTPITSNGDTNRMMIKKKRPRLEALRQSLQQANVPHLQVFAAQPPPPPPRNTNNNNTPTTVSSNVVVTKHTNQISTTTTSSSPNPSSSNLTKNQIDRTRYMLSQMPDPTAISSPSSSNGNILLDKHNRFHNYLRISVSERCNLRCTYCMPEQGITLQPKHQLLTATEIVHLASIFTQHGVNKFRITGGEPTLRHDLIDILAALKQLPITTTRTLASPPTTTSDDSQQHSILPTSPQYPSIGMTTNGITLFQNIHAYHAAGLNGVNISLDTLDEHKFSQLTRRPPTYFHNVMKSIQSAIHITTTIDPNFVVKINCVIMRRMNDNEIVDFIKLTEIHPTLQIRFIEYMPFQENGWNNDKFIPYQEIISHINENSHLTNVRLVPVPSNDPHDTTKWYTNSSIGNSSRIGFITSMSQHFCNSCNRLRLTADGQIKVCLFDGSSDMATTSISLRDAIRNDFTKNEIEKLIYLSVQKKHAILGGHTDPTHIMLDSNNNRPMTLIGG